MGRNELEEYNGWTIEGGVLSCFDADIFHGDVMHLADVITFQGRSIDELKQALWRFVP